MAWGNEREGWHPVGGSDGWDQLQAYWDAYWARKRAEEAARRRALMDPLRSAWNESAGQRAALSYQQWAGPTREQRPMPDYVQSYMPMVPPAAPGVVDPNMPGPPDPNVPDQNAPDPNVPDQNAPDPGLNLTPAYQSLGMDAAFMGPAKPRPQRRGGIYNLVLGAR